MSKTYTLTSTRVQQLYYDSYKTNWQSAPASIYGVVGKSNGYYCYIGYFFDEATLALLRTKNVTSMTLQFRTQNYPASADLIDISYALYGASASTAKRGNANATEESSTPIGDIYSMTHSTEDSVTTLTLTGASVPRYGFMIGRHASTSLSESYVLFDNTSYVSGGLASATLTVVTDEVTVEYDANGGSGAPEAQEGTSSTSLTLFSTKPVRSGYRFLGWATSSSASTASYAAGGTYTFSANTTLYAVWTLMTYTVTYDANGGTGAPAAQSKTHGVALTLSATQPTRSGYTFAGWALSAVAASADYAAGGTFTVDDNVTLYAVWAILTYTITYDANGGTGAPESQTKTHGVNLTLSSVIPTRESYNFVGWAVDSSSATADYESGDTYTADASVTMYAVWTLSAVYHTLTYDPNGGVDAPDPQTVEWESGSSAVFEITDEKPLRIGYRFEGWADTATGSVAYDAGDTISAIANKTVYAVWTELPRRKTPVYFGNSRFAHTPPFFQYDYGQALTFPDIELPESYEVSFGVSESETSVKEIGDEDGVSIPNALLTEGATVYAWIFLHEGEADGETKYCVSMPVIRRGAPSDPIPTDGEQSLVTQAIAALNAAVARANSYYVHEQTTAASTWTISHPLKKYPAVTIVDSAGTTVVGSIRYIDENTVECSFNGTFSGKAYLN